MGDPQALVAVFEQLEKIYEKLCECLEDKKKEVLLKITGIDRVFDELGDQVFLSPSFDNVGTDGNDDVRDAIEQSISDFNDFLTDLVTAAMLLNPDADSDCAALRVCRNTILMNGYVVSFNELPLEPTALAQAVNSALLEVKKLLIQDASSQDVLVESVERIFNLDGNLEVSFDKGVVLANDGQDEQIKLIQDDLTSIWSSMINVIAQFKDSFPPIN